MCSAWQRTLQGALVAFLLVTVGLLARYYPADGNQQLEQQVRGLAREVKLLKQEQAMPALVLNRYRNSICYIFGVYQVGFRGSGAGIARAYFRKRLCGGRWTAGHQSACGRALVRGPGFCGTSPPRGDSAAGKTGGILSRATRRQ